MCDRSHTLPPLHHSAPTPPPSQDEGRYAEAEPLLARALAISEEAAAAAEADPEAGPTDDEHGGRASVSQACARLAELYKVQGKLDQAEPLHRRSLAIDEARVPPSWRGAQGLIGCLAKVSRRTTVISARD